MLSVTRCKEILAVSSMPDSQVEKLRETLYALVENIVDEYILSCGKM